jgi:peroxiredoxin
MFSRPSPSMIGTRLLRSGRVFPLFVVTMLASTTRAADPPGSSSNPVLQLADGGYAAGEVRDSSQPGVLRWQAAPFVAPFEFAIRNVNTIQWPPPAKLDRPTGDFCFELAAGDVLFGSLIGIDEKKVELAIPRLGRIHVQRSNLHRIYRWRDGADLIYLGPNGLVGWHEPAGQKNWREESGQPTTDKEGASIRGDFGLPPRANIEFEISWKTKPDFVFALGVDDKDSTVKRAFRFEAWGGDLVVQRELEQEADLAVVQEVTAGPGRTHLQAYLDQQEGRILVFSPGGKQLADLKVAGNKPAALPGIYLANIRGDVRLEWLRIGRWNGEIPREARTDLARIHRADGSIAYGQLTRFLPDSKEFLVRGEKGESRVKEGDVSSVFLSPARQETPRMIRAVYQDGSRLSGELTKVEGGSLAIKVPGIEESLKLPIAGLRSVVVLSHEAAESKSATMPRLETDGVSLVGRLEDGREGPGMSCLVWHPAGSATASPLRPGISGKIIYKEPPPRPTTRQANPNQQRQQGMGGMALRFAQALAETPSSPSGEERRALYLRSGDVITSVITGIDEKGVQFRSSMSTSTFIPHDKVKAVELGPMGSLTVRLSKSKKERLLTLPRMQKASPPTHLIRSKNGDYLRGRVVMMDDKRVRLETRLEEKDLPRDRIAQIIWLHPEELDPAKKTATDEKKTRVQAVRNDGIRVTFTPDQFAGDTLSGRSDVLGATRVRVGEIDQLLIGTGIEEAAEHLTYGQWKLQNAPEPIEPAPEGGSSGNGATGTESPLVGKPAPDFELELVGGKSFHLADSKGKVVVLDFWATWCGPCIQAMPQVEKVTGEFDQKDVQLVAVNLQETPQQIKAMLERHQLKIPRVALDKDGSIAEKYQANAIPQTVIIGRDGNVARLFVGGGPHLGDQLREAIKATLAGEKPKEAGKSE